MSTWHVAPEQMQRYADGSIDIAGAFSVEAHLESCDTCGDRISRFVEPLRLERMWTQVAGAVAISEIGVVERMLRRLGVREHVARLLAATPALRLSWLLAIGMVLTIGVVAAYGSANGYVLFLVVAPLLPVAGVAASYGPGIDPTYEIGLASPMRSFHLLLIRACAVLATTTLMASAGALLLPGLDWRTVAWLLPSLGLVTATLGLGTIVRPLWGAAFVTFAWLAVTSAGATAAAVGEATGRSVFGDTMQFGSLMIAIAGGALLIARRDRFESGDRP